MCKLQKWKQLLKEKRATKVLSWFDSNLMIPPSSWLIVILNQVKSKLRLEFKISKTQQNKLLMKWGRESLSSTIMILEWFLAIWILELTVRIRKELKLQTDLRWKICNFCKKEINSCKFSKKDPIFLILKKDILILDQLTSTTQEQITTILQRKWEFLHGATEFYGGKTSFIFPFSLMKEKRVFLVTINLY